MDLYITGVLAPREAPAEEDSELGYGNLPPVGEDEEYDEDAAEPRFTAPALSPQKRPSTMGIRFVVQSKEPKADICLTWARYFQSEDGGPWKRQPRFCILRDVPLHQPGVKYLGQDGEVESQEKAELSFHIVPRRTWEGHWSVSLYLVNEIRVRKDRFPTAEHHIFQPQIRVRCRSGTVVSELGSSQSSDEEERLLAHLYRKRPVKAMGVLCSAVWREIDPQRPFEGEPEFPEIKRHPPFGWPDGELLTPGEREEFVDPDVRSEFTPVCVDPMPEVDGWPVEYGRAPELRADVLAQLFDPKRLSDALSPLLEGYEKWVERQDWTGIEKLRNDCLWTLERMRLGLGLLREDPDVRLAFCFANRAMDLQRRWELQERQERQEPLRWRPFQLGFILSTLESLANPQSRDRDVLDLLWVPTGTGKTEAYLFLILFILALRRRRARRTGEPEEGTTVITRYTLRLLTVQQFRRLLRAITAAEYLRVEGLPRQAGWLPEGAPREEFPWGVTSFTVGLWIGGGVTPNRLEEAIELLRGQGGEGEGEPAQVTHCPACGSILVVPKEGIRPPFTLHLVVSRSAKIERNLRRLFPRKQGGVTIHLDAVHPLHDDVVVLSLRFEGTEKVLDGDVDKLGNFLRSNGVEVLSARASRPGYFLRTYLGRTRLQPYDFEIICPAPPDRCDMQRGWCAGAPTGSPEGSRPGDHQHGWGELGLTGKEGYLPVEVQRAFREGHPCLSGRIPIPALTVDEQVYHRLPSVVIATVDKFARPPFEPRAGSLWGNITHHHPIWGYYRDGIPPHSGCSDGRLRYSYLSERVRPPSSPELVVQDELHLLEGPLGSLVGFYEIAVDLLAGGRAKYVASSATVRNADYQVAMLFCRRVALFPPLGPCIEDRFFVRAGRLPHPLEECPGRVYLGVCAPGRGPHTPQVRIWSHLLHATRTPPHPRSGPYRTLVGYFNSIRELAGAKALYRQDVREWLAKLQSPLQLSEDRVAELWRNTPSQELPYILEWLSSDEDPPDALFATSMFGTGVDIPRLSLMVVNGQPKSTSSYIQATGRVGRTKGALVVTFLRATRPRDLSHYESFCGYHLQLHRFVEPATVNPFSLDLVERFAGGPLSVFLLRCCRSPGVPWHEEGGASLMGGHRNDSDVEEVVEAVARRAERVREMMPGSMVPEPDLLRERMRGLLDRWFGTARLVQNLLYAEYWKVSRSVVLGDPAHVQARHEGRNIYVVFDNAPQSLREVEGTCTVGIGRGERHAP